MTRKLLILSGCLLLALNSCKTDIESSPANSIDHTMPAERNNHSQIINQRSLYPCK